MTHQKLSSERLMSDTFAQTMRDVRSHTNELASKTMARFTLLLFGVIVLLLLMTIV